MAQQPNAAAEANGQEHGAAGAHPHGALQLYRSNGAVLPPQIAGDAGARVRAAGHAAAPVLVADVAGPIVADVAGPLFPQGLVLDVDGALLFPLPRKSNWSCKLLPKIAEETGP